ncbi:unnamed protein product [Meloidogyne enterolobii]|uniref:Uncharacterized protein n=1 Tax=Meloidogyne enterolobii TaxID=390850 RepID=A0ACB1AV99_MELEN
MLRDELPFSPGDEVAVLDCPSDELWYGICGPRSGWFPAAYIRVIFREKIFFQIF